MAQDKYTKSAKGKECQVRIPGVCNFNNETTVFAHLGGAGIGAKHLNIHGAYCCSACHNIADGRVPHRYPPSDIKLWFLEGVIRTQAIMVKDGVLVL